MKESEQWYQAASSWTYLCPTSQNHPLQILLSVVESKHIGDFCTIRSFLLYGLENRFELVHQLFILQVLLHAPKTTEVHERFFMPVSKEKPSWRLASKRQANQHEYGKHLIAMVTTISKCLS